MGGQGGEKLKIVWLDISTAFSSIPHGALITALEKNGIGKAFTEIIKDAYNGVSMTNCGQTKRKSLYFQGSDRVAR